jgi:hypothetical protein
MIAATRVPILRSSGRQSLEGLLQLRLGDSPLIAPNSNCKAVGTAASPPRKSDGCKPTPWRSSQTGWVRHQLDAAACDERRWRGHSAWPTARSSSPRPPTAAAGSGSTCRARSSTSLLAGGDRRALHLAGKRQRQHLGELPAALGAFIGSALTTPLPRHRLRQRYGVVVAGA